MRVFVFLSFVVFVCADEPGYYYRPVEHSRSGLSFVPGSRDRGFSSPHYSLTSSASSQQPVSYNTPGGYGGYQTEFYTFTAPEDVFDDHAAVQKLSESLEKKARVIFIKNPENTAYENAVLALIRQAAEQKTAIYVLNKQHDISYLADKLGAVENNINRKPEVHFVKYRTPEDAYNAQRAIQSQYESFSDSPQSYNAGPASALNFASPAPKTFHGKFQTPNSEFVSPSIYPSLNV